jgi:hypothetical protein
LSHRHKGLHNQFIELISFIDLTNLRQLLAVRIFECVNLA